MDRDILYSIGDLAQKTGLTVKTIRFYSDRGIVAPTGRNPAGHRLYDVAALARLEFVRTLRGLGLNLATIGKVMDGESSLAEVAAAHAEALAAQINVLQLRHAVLTMAARHGVTPEEMELMSRLARLSEDERRRLVGDSLGSVFKELDADPHFAGISRSMTPELPDSPDTVQIQAWVELAEILQDSDFRASLRRMVQDHAAERASSPTAGPSRDLVAAVCAQAHPAQAGGVAPQSPQADAVVAEMTAHYARLVGHAANVDDNDLLQRLLARLERANDPRRQRYMQLLCLVNSWSAPEEASPALDWSVQALRARIPA
ncbi:MerR family transcriptional regulator [Actinomadura rudentiformis]|uniref:MerR family transcriptional regulator n=1 Tax=Actinomadura rudentiformis TaxID=359158 RepID=A0A6H9Z8S8_9ACTN|nr:MerR family transcriptional regulator [Actinomadura rudentiformis]KAB2350296.1 MerR family transcriptional regulator [Actinomadura rudentiformis]